MERRTFLATAGPALGGVLSGCQSDSEFGPPPEDVRLSNLRYRNTDRRSDRLHVILLEDGEPVYWTAKEVAPAVVQDDGSLLVQARTFEGYPTEPAPYVLYARLEDAPRSEWRTTRFDGSGSVSGDPDYLCSDVTIVIRDARLDLRVDLELPDDDTGSC